MMRPAIHMISLLGILSLSLLSISGCGEKRIHVSTASGSPGEETGASASGTDTAGLAGTSVDESPLSGQGTSTDEVQAEAVPLPAPVQPPAPVEPPNFGYDPNHMDESFKQNLQAGIPSEQDSGIEKSNTGSPTPLNDGNDISTQSSSSSMNGSPHDPTGTSPFTSQTEFQNDLSNLPKDTEPIPETFQVAKAEPSEIIREQLEKIQEEELATVSAGLEDVFFHFDSWTLTAEAKDSLQRDMAWLTNDPSALLIIEGHADQRGTQAYNMVLGKKRAMAVRDFLSQLGVDPSRLTVISYGKDKPFCQDTTEVCYQLNRRGHLLVQN
ncbi:OmpA family protein [Candidatus Nitrospira neomarina]|uniref:OmpA family protein n=1 Tax=Candidatus Nitrospira neomarina TaxID=3020899 RepID=A0AA96GEU3_9BACT|nr:OmpA family protein [Candidatus Nitrospira neomarina]WNM60879.1 OmpA family protein [Candidatus Nitrospira neomarina]